MILTRRVGQREVERTGHLQQAVLRVKRVSLFFCTALFALAWQATPATADTVVSCPFEGSSGDNAALRGFYVTNYPGTNIDQVTLAYVSDAEGTYTITLTARTGTYDGPIIGAPTVTASLPGAVPTTPVSFAFGGAPVAPGSTITFSQSFTGPGALFFDPGNGPLGGGGATCPGVTETDGRIPPLDEFRRGTVGLLITGSLPVITQAKPARPSNVFEFDDLKRNKKKGTATLTLNVSGPGEVALTGKGVVKQRSGGAEITRSARTVAAAGAVTLRIKARGKKKQKLNDNGQVKVKVSATYTPTGGEPNTQSKRIKLIKR